MELPELRARPPRITHATAIVIPFPGMVEAAPAPSADAEPATPGTRRAAYLTVFAVSGLFWGSLTWLIVSHLI